MVKLAVASADAPAEIAPLEESTMLAVVPSRNVIVTEAVAAGAWPMLFTVAVYVIVSPEFAVAGPLRLMVTIGNTRVVCALPASGPYDAFAASFQVSDV